MQLLSERTSRKKCLDHGIYWNAFLYRLPASEKQVFIQNMYFGFVAQMLTVWDNLNKIQIWEW